MTGSRHDPHERFVEALQSIDSVVWEMDAQTWRFTFVSPRAEKVFGYPVARWIEEPTFWQDVLVHPEDRSWCVRYCSTACGDCRNHAFLYRAHASDGRVLWIRDVVRVIPDEEGRPALMRGVMVDATEEMLEREPGLEEVELDYDAPELEPYRVLLGA